MLLPRLRRASRRSWRPCQWRTVRGRRIRCDAACSARAALRFPGLSCPFVARAFSAGDSAKIAVMLMLVPLLISAAAPLSGRPAPTLQARDVQLCGLMH